MKKIRYIMSLLCVLLCANSVKAYQTDFSSENFVSEAKESYVKYAAVNFIVKRSTIKNDANGNDLDNSPIKEGKGCPSGESLVNGQCINVSACNNSFPLTSVSSKIGSYVTKNCGSGNRYCYTSCSTGWKKNGCSCEASDCGSYPFSESNGHNCNGTASCKTGDSYRYKCTGCATGYNLASNGTCTDKACSEYGAGYFGEPTTHCKASDVKRNGEKYCYKCTACEDGWDLSNGVCSETKCSYTKSQVSHCSSYDTLYKSGDGMCYRCSACEDGYTLNNTGTACTAKTCTNGYVAGSTNLSRCISVSSYKGGENYCHLCNSCVYDYYKSNGGCKACTWSDHTLDTCPGGCNCSNYRVDTDCRYKYKITSAQSERYVSGNSCPACTWGNYTLNSCPSGCNCSNYRQADTCSYKYKVTSAQSERYVSGNTCPACTWGDYTLSSCPSGCNCSNYRQADTCSYKYKVTSAQSNHYVSGNSCPACTWNGYTLSSCPSDWNCASDTCGGTTKYAKTTPKCTWSGYTLASCPDGCNCASDTCGGTTKYSVSSAQSDHYISGNTCPICTWNGYTLTSCPKGCSCKSNLCGNTRKYNIVRAQEGWYLDNGKCYANTCDSNLYPFSEYPDDEMGTVDTCYEGDNEKYGFVECEDGFVLTSGKCEGSWPEILVEYVKTDDYPRKMKFETDSVRFDPGKGNGFSYKSGKFEVTYDKAGTYILRFRGSPTKLHAAVGSYKYCCNSSSHPDGVTRIEMNMPSLQDAEYLFYGIDNKYLPGQPNVDVSKMTLPPKLKIASDMFAYSKSIVADIPALPDTLEDGSTMFSHSGFKGNLPKLPDNLKKGDDMFNWMDNVTGPLPSTLPSGIESASYMFWKSKFDAGTCPAKPDSLKRCEYMWMIQNWTKHTCSYGMNLSNDCNK